MADDRSFYADIAPFDRFEDVVDEARYRDLPEDWLIGMSDVTDSTRAIAEGRYKAVNMVGASTIAAVYNALGGASFPFVFGGDGAAFAVAAADAGAVRAALAAARTWAREEAGLNLRAALVPVGDIAQAGQRVAVARFKVAPELSYAMFAGGGIAWAEAEMKAGHYEVPPAPPGAKPDLSGLSCRFMPIDAAQGEVVSLLIRPRADASREAFATLVRQVVAIVDGAGARGGSPVPELGPRFVWPPRNLRLEVRATRGKKPGLVWGAFILAQHLMLNIVHAVGGKIGTFDPKVYRREVTANTDFRKFGDGLMLTVDCTPDTIARLKAVLERAQADGIADHGLHRQRAALMTCFVPSPFAHDHIHFVDGASGGYAKAAEMLKRQMGGSGAIAGSD